MKKNILFVYLLAVLFLSCQSTVKNHKSRNVITSNLPIKSGICGNIEQINHEFTSIEKAIEYLEKENKNMLPNDYIVDKKPLDIDYKKDNRKFYSIGFPNKNGVYESIALSHAVDSYGHIYAINWCLD